MHKAHVVSRCGGSNIVHILCDWACHHHDWRIQPHTHDIFCVCEIFCIPRKRLAHSNRQALMAKKIKSTFWIDSFALIWTLVFLNWFVWICWPGWLVGPPWWMPWCFREWRGLPWHDLPADHLGEVHRILFLPSPLDELIMRLLYWLHDLSGDHHSKRPPRTLFQDLKCIMQHESA